MNTSSPEPAPAPDTPEQASFRAEARTFLAQHCAPKSEQGPWAMNLQTDEREAEAHFALARRWQHTLFDGGFGALTYPSEYGGRDGAPWLDRIFREECDGFDVPRGFITSTIAMLGPTLLRHGTPEQRAHYLPRLLSGADTWCQLFSEPGSGSDLASLACRAIRDGDEFVIDGQKVWTSGAQFCDWGMLLVRTSPDLPKHQGVTFLLLDMRTPGVEVRPLVQATGASHFNEVFLSGVRVPVANVLGEIDEGWGPARTVLSNEAAFIGGGGSGTTKKLLLLAQLYGATEDLNVRQQLAQYYTRERLLDFMGQRIRAAARAGRAPIDPSLLKLYIAQSKVLSGNLAVTIAGPAALVGGDADEHVHWVQVELMNRYAFSIGGGTNEVQRNNVGERALGLPREPRPDQGLAWRDVPRS